LNSVRTGPVVISWLKGIKHRFYEDRYHLLIHEARPVRHLQRGEILAVLSKIYHYWIEANNFMYLEPGWPLENPPPVAGSKSPTSGSTERGFI